jgi:hypothetical protein
MPTTASLRQLRIAQLAFAGAAAVALLALSHAARADTPPAVRLAGWTAPGGFAADDTDDQQAQLQQMLQSMQQAEQQNEEAQQQFNQDMQQQQTYENQFNDP